MKIIITILVAVVTFCLVSNRTEGVKPEKQIECEAKNGTYIEMGNLSFCGVFGDNKDE